MSPELNTFASHIKLLILDVDGVTLQYKTKEHL